MAFGNFAGGFARGLTNSIQLNQRQEELATKKQALVDARKKAMLDEGQARINTTFNLAKESLGDLSNQLIDNPAVAVRTAIGKMETGGRKDPYQTIVDVDTGAIVNPQNEGTSFNPRRVYGTYGIKGSNIDPSNPNNWIEEAGLPAMTPAEFLSNESAQDAVAAFQIDKLLKKYGGDPSKVAAEWLGGPGWESAGADVFGTTPLLYAQKFEKVLTEDVVGGASKQYADFFGNQLKKLASDMTAAGFHVDVTPQLKALEAAQLGTVTKTQAAIRDARAEVASRQTTEAGLEAGGTPENEAAILAGTRVKPEKPLVTIDNRQENAFSKELGTQLAKDYVEIRKQGRTSAKLSATLGRVRSAINQGIDTGFGQKALLSLKRAGQAMGVDVGDDVGGQELILAMGNQMALMMRNPEGGFGLTGNTSNRDLQFLEASVPGLEKTVEGNRLVIDFMSRVAERDQEMARQAAKYVADNGQLDVGWDIQWDQYTEANPLFDDDDIAAVEEAAQQPEVEAKPKVRRFNPETGKIE